MLPICQDTGTAIVVGKKGEQVLTGGATRPSTQGIYRTYAEQNPRYSQVVPLSMYEEKNNGSNLPAQIDIYATDGANTLCFSQKAGSANKTYLFQKTKALLNPDALEALG